MWGADILQSDVDKEEINEALGDTRRKLVVDYLKQENKRVGVSEIAKYIAREETGRENPPPHVLEAIQESLYVNDLPKLKQVGVVDYEELRTIQLEDQFKNASLYQEVLHNREISWSALILGVSVIGIALVTATMMEVTSIAGITADIWALITLGIIAVTALYHTYKERTI